MSEHIEKTITELQRHIADLDEQANDAKKTINSLCKVVGRPILYAAIEETSAITNAPLQGDEYHGRPLATAVREILENRRSLNMGPATLDELFVILLKGGYQFTGKNDEIKRRGLSIALAKNQTFYKLPNAKIGIREWYPNAKEQRQATNGNGTKNEEPSVATATKKSNPEDILEATEVPNKPR